jgi:hypothetical protein
MSLRFCANRHNSPLYAVPFIQKPPDAGSALAVGSYLDMKARCQGLHGCSSLLIGNHFKTIDLLATHGIDIDYVWLIICSHTFELVAKSLL